MANQRTTYFAVVPEWLIAPASPNAIKLYAVLDRYADGNGECWPSAPVLSEKCGFSVPTVWRTIKELEAHGALLRYPRVRDDGGQTSNKYRLFRDPPPSTSDRSPSTTGDPRNRVSKNQSVSTSLNTRDALTEAGASAPESPATSPELPGGSEAQGEAAPTGAVTAKSKRVRRVQDARFKDLWQAAADVGLKAPVHPSARSDHANLIWALYDEGATGADLRARAAAYRKHETLGHVMFTLPALTKHWHALAVSSIAFRRQTPEEIEAQRLADEARERALEELYFDAHPERRPKEATA